MKHDEKLAAINLRKEGESIKVIAKVIGVSKASVSNWVRDIILSENVRKRLCLRSWTPCVVEKRRNTRLKNEIKKRSDIVQLAKRDIAHISSQDLRIIGTMLYWAEGGKTKRGMVRLANSDPSVIRVFMKFLRKTCLVPESKFRAHIHTFSHTNILNAELYWSQLTGIPLSQFFKTYSKSSKAGLGKRDTLPYGTVDIYVCDTALFLTIQGWTEKIAELLLK